MLLRSTEKRTTEKVCLAVNSVASLSKLLDYPCMEDGTLRLDIVKLRAALEERRWGEMCLEQMCKMNTNNPWPVYFGMFLTKPIKKKRTETGLKIYFCLFCITMQEHLHPQYTQDRVENITLKSILISVCLHICLYSAI